MAQSSREPQGPASPRGAQAGAAEREAVRPVQAPETVELHDLLRTSGYRRMLLLSALVGIPVSLLAFGFVALEHEMQHGVWVSLPHALGLSAPPWWWPLPCLTLAGLLVAPCVTRLPGHGGHVPAAGFGAGGPSLPSHVPGVVLAALASLSLGAVLGPEAPLMALGSGLALAVVRSAQRAEAPQLATVLGTAGSAAAISTIFGSPLVAAVLLIEAAGIGGPQLFALILPSLLASGVGALVFTGFGRWTGLDVGSLKLPLEAPVPHLDTGDFLWGLPLAALVAAGVAGLTTLGRRTAAWTGRRTVERTVLCAAAVGVCIAAYALATGRDPAEAALSGQSTLAVLAGDPHAWPVSALLLLVLFKGLGWAVSLGSLRGGPIFPSILLGAAFGTACSGLPGFGTVPAMAAGLTAAATAVMRLPVSAVVLSSLLLGKDAAEDIPLVVLAAVVGFAVGELLRNRTHGEDAAAPPAPPAPGAPGAGGGPGPGGPAHTGP
ncbi:chloride channel protein [Streptomyces sp. NPDC001380]|uniref:chloride channel protein n=1 Tax=Streptomyces sp. NPDC001380 TaxID=3364566 RepID=UPI003685BE90